MFQCVRGGAEKFGTKAEVKNLNSFRFAKIALDYEIAQYVAVLEGGKQVHQETRLYNAATGETEGMRSKLRTITVIFLSGGPYPSHSTGPEQRVIYWAPDSAAPKGY